MGIHFHYHKAYIQSLIFALNRPSGVEEPILNPVSLKFSMARLGQDVDRRARERERQET